MGIHFRGTPPCSEPPGPLLGVMAVPGPRPSIRHACLASPACLQLLLAAAVATQAHTARGKWALLEVGGRGTPALLAGHTPPAASFRVGRAGWLERSPGTEDALGPMSRPARCLPFTFPTQALQTLPVSAPAWCPKHHKEQGNWRRGKEDTAEEGYFIGQLQAQVGEGGGLAASKENHLRAGLS